jgi:hypothetical protein
MLDYIEKIQNRIEERSKVCKTISEKDMWTTHGTLIWEAEEFLGTPHFYPVYKWGNFYSYSLLALIIKKGNLNPDTDSINYANIDDFLCLSASLNIDKDIKRIGAPHLSGYSIQDINEYAEKLANALIVDTQNIQEKNQGYTNYVLCGGKDSLNLLLLPWKEKVVALSAEPNYRFVKKFVEENSLNIEVCLLEDKYDPQELHDEVFECCCRVDMVNWRWGAHLREISQENNGKIIFWKGQMADLYTTNKWKVYMHPIQPVRIFAQKVYKRLEPIIPFKINRDIGRKIQPIVINSAWERGAVMQGCHMAFIREIADCLVLSAYHGPEVMKVLEEVDLGSVAQKDMRELVGEILLKRPVIYPIANPAPPPSKIRNGLGQPDKFMSQLKQGGIVIKKTEKTDITNL